MACEEGFDMCRWESLASGDADAVFWLCAKHRKKLFREWRAYRSMLKRIAAFPVEDSEAAGIHIRDAARYTIQEAEHGSEARPEPEPKAEVEAPAGLPDIWQTPCIEIPAHYPRSVRVFWSMVRQRLSVSVAAESSEWTMRRGQESEEPDPGGPARGLG